jgi:hypothetical protein
MIGKGMPISHNSDPAAGSEALHGGATHLTRVVSGSFDRNQG